MTNNREIDPMTMNLLSIYAKMYNMSVEDLLAELDRMPGEGITDKLREYVNLRRGVSAKGYLATVYRHKEYTDDQGNVRYRVAVQVKLPDEEKQRLAEAFQLDIFHFDDPVFTIWTSDKRVVDQLNDIPIGSKVLITGIRTSTSETGTVFLNARSIIPQGVDPSFLDSISLKPEELKGQVFEESAPIFIAFPSEVIVDPIEKVSSTSGKPKVRVYLGDHAVVDFVSSAFTKVKQLLGDPYDQSKWNEFLKNRRMWVRALYQRDVGGIPYFTVVNKNSILST